MQKGEWQEGDLGGGQITLGIWAFILRVIESTEVL